MKVGGADTFVPFSSDDVEALIPPMSSNHTGKITVSSSTNDGNVYLAFDGNSNTQYNGSRRFQNNDYIQVDLGEERHVDNITMYYQQYGTAGSKVINVRYSNDGVNWQPVSDGDYYGHSTNLEWHKLAVGMTARYFRMVFTTTMYQDIAGYGFRIIQFYGH